MDIEGQPLSRVAGAPDEALLEATEHWPALYVAAGVHNPSPPALEPCHCCGRTVRTSDRVRVRRGRLSILQHPEHALWNGRPIRLSPTEIRILTTIAVRGTATHAQIDEAIRDAGSDPSARRIWIGRIQKKLRAVGAGSILMKAARNAWMVADNR